MLFNKILIANRGEIAVRIIRTAKKMGIRSAVVYAEDDAGSLHVALADEAFLLSGQLLKDTYLNQEKLIDLALQCGAGAVHPGYGFLSENASFARKVEEAGLIFIGATPEQIELMGAKTQAVEFAKSLNIPVIPGAKGTPDEIIAKSASLDYPLLVKAVAGGGGKGMEIVTVPEDLPAALAKAYRQALLYFGDGTLFVEKYLRDVRHIEVQVMGDGAGNAVHLHDRECSVQRRYQKLIEEAPVTSLSSALKERLQDYALTLARAVNYRGAGTVEFLVDNRENGYFLEMNTRLQVEHPVTEMVTGLDLVEWQLLVSSGMGLPLKQNEIKIDGHAIEVRICAEDPACGFLPSSGVIHTLVVPADTRWDSFIREDGIFSAAYDSLAGKLIAPGRSREEAVKRMEDSLQSLLIGGLKTNQLFLLKVIQSVPFRTNNVTTCFLEGQSGTFLSQLKDEKDTVPVKVLVAAYLLHHFYRSEDIPVNCFGEYWRIHTAFNLVIDGSEYNAGIKRENKTFRLLFENSLSVISDVSFQKGKVTFRTDHAVFEVLVFDTDSFTVLQVKAFQFVVKSRHIRGQFNLQKTAPGKAEKNSPTIVSGLFGRVIDVLVGPGDRLTKGQDLLVIESMKTEFTIRSPLDAVVKNVHVAKGELVQDQKILVDLES